MNDIYETEEARYIPESDWNAPSDDDLQDYLSGNLLTERPSL